MNICANNHDEIVFEGKLCPLCEALADIEALEKEIDAQEQ